MDSVYYLINTAGLIANLELGIYILSLGFKSRENRIFFLETLILSFWCLCVSMLISSDTHTEALLWSKLLKWPVIFSHVITLHFFMVFTGIRVSGFRAWRILPFYIAGVATAFITEIGTLEIESLGYKAVAEKGITANIILCISVYTLILAISLRAIKKHESKDDRIQILLLLTAITIPFIGGVATEIIPAAIGLPSAPLTSAFTVFTAVLIAYTIRKYKLMDPTEKRLREVKEKYNKIFTIFNHLPDHTILLSEDLSIIEANSESCKHFGLSHNEITGQNLHSFLDTSVCRETLNSAADSIKKGQIIRSEVSTSDKSFYHIFIPTESIDSNDRRNLLVISRDITEQRESRSRLIESEKKYKNLSEFLPVGLFESDNKLNLTYVNTAGIDMFGYRREDLEKGINGLDMFTPESRIRAKDIIQRRLNGEKIPAVEYTCRKKDGTTFPVIFHVNTIFKDSKFIGLRGVIIDISERKRLQEELNQSQKMEAVGQLAGGIAHDFNNTLTIITGAIQLLDKKMSDPSLKKYTKSIRKASIRSAEIINKLLAFSRKGQYRKNLTNIHWLIRDAYDLLVATLDKKISINLDLRAESFKIIGDDSQLSNVLFNLGINSRDAMPEGGTLSFHTENTGIDSEFCSTHPFASEGDYLKISVRDTGSGMDEHTQRHAFEPFFTTKETGKGTGMGLAAVYGTVKHHKGFIFLDSKPGKGTEFNIYLPLPQPGDIKKDQPCSKVSVGEGNILIVDDEEMLREV
ncbi:MAG: PAS domain S-box protein, partial [Chitinivibrionales bacterium]